MKESVAVNQAEMMENLSFLLKEMKTSKQGPTESFVDLHGLHENPFHSKVPSILIFSSLKVAMKLKELDIDLEKENPTDINIYIYHLPRDSTRKA